MQITEDVMQQHPEVNVITGNNDSGPLGAVEAVKGLNLSQDVLDKFYICLLYTSVMEYSAKAIVSAKQMGAKMKTISPEEVREIEIAFNL